MRRKRRLENLTQKISEQAYNDSPNREAHEEALHEYINKHRSQLEKNAKDWSQYIHHSSSSKKDGSIERVREDVIVRSV